MLSYYETIIIITWMTLAILCVLIKENNRIRQDFKPVYYLNYFLIALAALMEWAGLKINGNPNMSSLMLRLVKCLDYILTPIAAAYVIIGQMRIRNIYYKVLLGTLFMNAVFQIVSFFTGWMTVVDSNNCYSHGPLYFVYMIMYFAIIILVVIEFIIYGRSFKKQNRTSLYMMMVLVMSGALMQELIGGEVRTVYITLTIGITLLFIHATEFTQLSSDEFIEQQQKQLETDVLTGLCSRYAYTKALDKYSSELPESFAAFSIDINDLKSVNDTLGHEAGDELICGAAGVIEKVFGKIGRCYRTGGDEFVVLVENIDGQAETKLKQLNKETSAWKGQTVKELSLSAGYALASDYPELSCEKLVRESDLKMYKAKSDWYLKTGKDRRGRPDN